MTKATKKTNAKPATKANPHEGKSLRAATSDVIVLVKSAATGNGIFVGNKAGKSIIIAPWQDRGETRKLAVVGGSLKALEAHLATLVKPTAQMARGTDSHTAPHSAKAVADQKRDAPKSKAPKAPKAAPKAGKNKQPSRGAERSYSVLAKKNEAKPDSWRHHMTAMIVGSKDTASAKAAHAKSRKFPTNKLDFNWAANNGFIKFAK